MFSSLKLLLTPLLFTLVLGACQCGMPSGADVNTDADANRGVDVFVAADAQSDVRDGVDAALSDDVEIADAFGRDVEAVDVHQRDAGPTDVARRDVSIADAEGVDVDGEDVVITYCGDGIVNGNELCDDGANDGAYGGCEAGCAAFAIRCGDGVVQAAQGEVCDDGFNDSRYNGCQPLCDALGPRCGDGLVQQAQGEVCDDGVNDGAYEGCLNDCSMRAARCGDGLIQAGLGEVCDDGLNDGAYEGCDACTTLGPRCGDGVVQSESGEACDEGVNDGITCGADCSEIPVFPRVVFNEIMYHPVREDAFTDRHEFLELYNTTDAALELSGWAITEGIEFVFAEGAQIAAFGYVVVTSDRDAFLAEYTGVDPAIVFGNYDKQLGNGGDTLVLVRDNATISDAMTYDDDFPWPTSADSMGANSDWLAPAVLPYVAHQFRGHSLERVSSAGDSNDVANWSSSLLDQQTPGAANHALRAAPLAQVVARRVIANGSENQADPSELISVNDEVRIEITLSKAVAGLSLERFIDDINAEGEATTLHPLNDEGSEGDAVAGDLVYTLVLPADAERSIVRYRVRGDRGEGDESFAPRAREPFEWFAYFISPDHSAEQTRTYELFISENAWTQMYTNIEEGRTDGCAQIESWNEREEAVFVYEGHVYDVRVRHQGSIFQRRNGEAFVWNFDGPLAPDPLEALSWRVAFPRYDRLNKRKVILLNKLNQACAGFSSMLGYKMAQMNDLVAPKNVRYARMFINGGYYNMTLEIDRMGEVMVRDYEKRYAEKYGLELAPDGHLYKSTGSARRGPYVRSEGNPIPDDDFCGYSTDERYRVSYDRKNHEFLDHTNLISLIEDGAAAEAAGDVALRDFASTRYDVDRMLNFLVARQYHSSWDDDNHNWFIYETRPSGRFFMIPWDLDLTFGSTSFANGSRYYAPLDVGDPKYIGDSTVRANVNYLKYYFMRAYYNEYITHLKAQNETHFHKDALIALLNEFYAELNQDDANSAASVMQCSADERRDSIEAFIENRYDFIRAWPPTDRVNLLKNATALASSESSAASFAHDEILHINNFFESATDDLLPEITFDLGAMTTIENVHLTTGIECCDTEIDYNLTLQLLDESQNIVESRPIENPWNGFGEASSNENLPLYIDWNFTPTAARFVRVRKEGFPGSEQLRISEIRAH